MDPPVSTDLENQKQKVPSHHCDLYDTELVHKISQTFLPGLATACVDNTTGDIFRSPGSVAADIRKEMIDYLTLRSETFVAEHIVVLSDSEASHHPFDVVSDFIDDFATSKRNLFSRVSGWLLSERREDNVDDFAQEMEISGFWLSEQRQGLAQTLLKNVDFKNLSHCEMKFQTEGELAEHVLICGYRTMDCGNEGCNAVFCKKQMEIHDSVCPFKIVPCEQGCDESGGGIMRREMDRHCITVCPMKLVNCAFRAVGCLDDVRQCEVGQHQVEKVGSHLLYVLKSIYKEASLDDLKPRAEEIQQLSVRLSEARNARSLTNLVKEIDAKLGPLEIKPKSVAVLEKGLEEPEVKGKPETKAEDEVVSKEAEGLGDDVKKVSEAEIAENVNEEGELKAQKLLEIGEFIKEGGDSSSAGVVSERTETKAPEVVVMDEDKEADESGETKHSITNGTRGLETEVNEENREMEKSDETKSEAPSRIVMDKEENEEGTETINLSARREEEEKSAETEQSRANETSGLETEANEENREAKKSDETESEAPERIVMDKEENEDGAETINLSARTSDEGREEEESEEAKQSRTNETLETEANEESREAKKSDETKSEAPSEIVMDREENEEEEDSAEAEQSRTNEIRGLETEGNEENREAKKSDETKNEAVMDKEENEEGAETINSRATATDEAEEALSKSSEAFSKAQAETEPNMS